TPVNFFHLCSKLFVQKFCHLAFHTFKFSYSMKLTYVASFSSTIFTRPLFLRNASNCFCVSAGKKNRFWFYLAFFSFKIQCENNVWVLIVYNCFCSSAKFFSHLSCDVIFYAMNSL